jgi:hypothetical protein
LFEGDDNDCNLRCAESSVGTELDNHDQGLHDWDDSDPLLDVGIILAVSDRDYPNQSGKIAINFLISFFRVQITNFGELGEDESLDFSVSGFLLC